MKIFGKRGCDDYCDWKVKINLLGEVDAEVAEQLTEEEAKKIYDKLIEQFKNKEPLLEVEYKGDNGREVESFVKSNIVSIEMK